MIEEIFTNCPWYKKIELLRTSKEWCQEKAGEMCCTYKKHYWQWEKGYCYPRAENRKIIAAVFGIDINYLFSPNDQLMGNKRKKTLN